MDWTRLLNDTRLGGSASQDSTRSRSEFQKDHDRIVFSEAFRKLGRKTQVHPLPKNDRVHNRLTHSLEVSCVGRSLGEITGTRLIHMGVMPPHLVAADVAAIVQAACLAHDIGNPPFGHAGEFAVRDWYAKQDRSTLGGIGEDTFRDLCIFEGNAQGFRMLTTLVESVGIRLTYATLATFVKYPWSSKHARQHKQKYNYYASEEAEFVRIFDALGITRIEPGVYARHPLAYLVEAADDICYAIIDIEDGYEMGVIAQEELIDALFRLLPATDQQDYLVQSGTLTIAQKIRRLRGRAVDTLISEASAAFFAHYDDILAGRFTSSIIEVAAAYIRDGIRNAKNLARTKIFLHSRKMEIEIGAYSAVATILEACAGLINDVEDGQLSYRSSRIQTVMGDMRPLPALGADENSRRVTDFIASLTDNQTTRLAQVIRGNPAD